MVTREWEILQKLLNDGIPWQEAIKRAGVQSLPIERPSNEKPKYVNNKQRNAIRINKHG